LGTDTGGSIRIPAALCGIVGVKPTAGRVSRNGVVPLSSSFDHVGPLARSVADAAIMLSAIAGYDRLDSHSVFKESLDFAAALGRRMPQVRLGWPRKQFLERSDPAVQSAIETAAAVFESVGGVVREVSLPHAEEAVEAGMRMEYAEAARFHNASGFLPGRAKEYGERLRKRLEKGAQMLAVDYLSAQELQAVVRADFEAVFRDVDAILVPTVPVGAPRLGQATVSVNSHREPVRSALIGINPAANFTGLPAITLPCGFNPEGLPIGMQLIGPAFQERKLLRLAFVYEQATEWHLRLPKLEEVL
jgi:aspartyl-tRNA(Asn)/glutamyl-tRNA(Gln) amidotransferase subunit A